jgi:hypothetical protein
MSLTNISNVSKLQKKVIKVITKSAYNAHTEPLFLGSKILPFEKLILQSKLLFMHSVDFNYAPLSFSLTHGPRTITEIWIMTCIIVMNTVSPLLG